MKALVGLIVLICIGLAIAYYSGGGDSFDPTRQGKAARTAIKPGMTWTQVVNLAGAPRFYRDILKKSRKAVGGPKTYFKPSGENRFNPGSFPGLVSSNALQHGFLFDYRFSGSVAFRVEFDGRGVVTAIEDQTTEADLLQMN